MRPLILPLLVLSLSGCTLFQSNVKGRFVCGAARGTCAPSTTIDDAALHTIDARKADADVPEAPGLPVDKGPSRSAPSADERHGALKVVYPSWRDLDGRAHKRTVAYISVDAPGLVATPSAPRAADNPSGTNMLTIAEAAPPLPLISPPPSPASPQTTIAGPQPSAAATATPIGAIQAQVRDILAKTPRPITKTPALAPLPHDVVAPAGSASTGGTFPPQGE